MSQGGAYVHLMAADRKCFWCGSENVVWGFARLSGGADGQWHVLHEMRRACPTHIGDCLDGQEACQDDAPSEPELPSAGTAEEFGAGERA